LPGFVERTNALTESHHAIGGIMKYLQGTIAKGILYGTLALLWSTPASAQTPTIPDFLIGTYDLQMQASSPSSPIKDDEAAEATISGEGVLCADGLTFPVPFTKTGEANRIYWLSTDSNLEFSVSSTAPFAGIQIASASGASFGSLTGTKTSDVATLCGGAARNEAFFALAENKYPELFASSVFIYTQKEGLTSFRYYPLSSVFLSIASGNVSARGGQFGQSPVQLGNVDELLEAGDFELTGPVSQFAGTLDSYYVSTYRLKLQNATSFSPVKNNTELTFVITPDFKLCVGESILGSPVYEPATGRVLWHNHGASYYYALQLLPDSQKNSAIEEGKFGFYNAGGQLYGSFEGERISLGAECPDARGANPDLPEIDLMFSLAEQRMPELFLGGPQTFNQTSQGYVYRFYNDSGITIRIRDRAVFGTGGVLGAGQSYLGTLDEIISDLQKRTMPMVLATELTGTYAVSFASEGAFSPIADNSNLGLAIAVDGRLCMDGVVLGSPYTDAKDPSLIQWSNVSGGYIVQLDNDTNSGTSIDMNIRSRDGQLLGTLSGSKTLLGVDCDGISGSDLDIEGANDLFNLAERYYSSLFPASTLNFNEYQGSALQRSYPQTGMMVRIDENQVVTVSGGGFGSSGRAMGTIQELLDMFRSPGNLEAADLYRLSVEGEVWQTMLNLSPLRRRIQIHREGQLLPESNQDEALSSVLSQIFGNELRGSNVFTFEIIENSANSLIFSAQVKNETQLVGKPVLREYDLVITYKK